MTTFVKDIKSKCLLRNKRSIKSCLQVISGEQSSSAKRKKIVFTTAVEDPELTRNSQSYDLESISTDIRKRILKWQRKQLGDAVSKLREHTHYDVTYKLDSSDCLDVHVSCKICDKIYKLHHKKDASGSNVIMISNWTSHIKNVSMTVRYPSRQRQTSYNV